MRILTGSSKCVISIFAIFLTVLIASVTSYGQNGVTPGSQPETIWSATMTVGAWRYTQGDGRSGTGYGYDANRNIGSLSNRTFTYRDTTYRIDAFYYTRLDGYHPNSSVAIKLNKNGPSHCASDVLDVYVNSAWESLSTRADSPNMTCSNLLNRSNTNWSLGQQISLTIRAIPKPPDVSTLAATYEENQVNLSCETPCDGGKDIIRHEYRQKTRSGTFGSWIPIPNSGAGGVNVAGYSITSLNNTEQFIVFQVSIKHGCVIRLLG